MISLSLSLSLSLPLSLSFFLFRAALLTALLTARICIFLLFYNMRACVRVIFVFVFLGVRRDLRLQQALDLVFDHKEQPDDEVSFHSHSREETASPFGSS